MRFSKSQSLPRRKLNLVLSGTLVFLSVLGSWWLIESSKATEEFLITATDLPSGTPLTAEVVQTREIALFDVGEKYLRKGELVPGDYLLRPIASGEAVPKSAVGSFDQAGWSNLVVTPSVELSSQVKPGSLVSIWSAAALDYQSFAEPVLQALGIEVIAVRLPQGNFQGDSSQVELRVPTDTLPGLIRSIANKDAIVLTATGKSLAD